MHHPEPFLCQSAVCVEPPLNAPRVTPRPAIFLLLAPLLALVGCGDDSSGSGGAGGGAPGAGGSGDAPVTVTTSSSVASSSGAGGSGGGSAACEDVTCPTGRVCREDGACIVDLDPGGPAGDAVADFEAIWSYLDEAYGAFPATDVDWLAVRDTYRPRVAAASTPFAAAWEIEQAVAAIGDGHTAAYSDAVCNADPGFSFAYSDVGACVVESGGALVVHDRVEGSGFELGDVLLDVEGRTVEQALHDLARQPRCFFSASTAAQDRANRVASVLFRNSPGGAVKVRRDGSEVTVAVASTSNGLLPCDGRIGLPDEVERGPEVTTAVTEGDVLLVRLARFGTFEAEFVDGPVLDALRDAFEEASDHAGVILDLRGNPGGYVTIYMALASWLFPDPTVLFRCRNKSGPGHDDHSAPFEQTSDPDPTLQYAGPLAVLVDARSFSASDFTSMWVHETGRGVTVGAPSGGGFGNGSGAEGVAEGYSLGVSDILCENLDGDLLEGNPPPVDIPVELDPEDVRAGVDTVVVAAEAWVLGG